MKAILVIDLPKGYGTDDLLIDFCLHTKGEYKPIRKSGNNPLRPMPEKNTWDVTENGYVTEYAEGWNACLEEITGEAE